MISQKNIEYIKTLPLKEFGVKYISIEIGEDKVLAFGEDNDIDVSYCPGAKYVCELSWGSGEEDKYDFAYVQIGVTLQEAISECLKSFSMDVISGIDLEKVNAAKDAGIYQTIISS